MAIRRAAVTSSGIGQERLFVIDGDLFSGLNVAQREEQNVPVEDPQVSVRIAGVVDVVSAVAAATSVQAPAAVNITDAKKASLECAFLRFQIRNSLAGIFSNLPATFEMNDSETASAVDS